MILLQLAVLVFVIATLIAVAIAVFIARRTILCILFSIVAMPVSLAWILMILPVLLLISILTKRVGSMQRKGREHTRMYRLLHGLLAFSLRYTPRIIMKPLETSIDLFTRIFAWASEQEYREDMQRSLKGLRKKGHIVDVNVLWNNAQKRKPVIVTVTEKGSMPPKKADMFFVEQGVKAAIKRKFLDVAKDAAIARFRSEGHGVVVYRDNKLILEAEARITYHYAMKGETAPYPYAFPESVAGRQAGGDFSFTARINEQSVTDLQYGFADGSAHETPVLNDWEVQKLAGDTLKAIRKELESSLPGQLKAVYEGTVALYYEAGQGYYLEISGLAVMQQDLSGEYELEQVIKKKKQPITGCLLF